MERFVGLDVHRDFCEVAIVESGRVRSAGRVATTPEALTLFAQSLGPHAHVLLEATANAVAIAGSCGRTSLASCSPRRAPCTT